MTTSQVSQAPVPVLFQSPQWGAVVAYYPGVHAYFYNVDYQGRMVRVLVVHHPLAWGYWYAHIPRGPLGTDVDLLAFCKDLKKQLPARCVWIMCDPEREEGIPLQGRLRLASRSIFPSSTLRIDLRPALENILAQMKEKGRYNIRLAGRKGVLVSGYQYGDDGTLRCIQGEDVLDAPIEAYGILARETMERDGFRAHKTGYYEHFLRTLGQRALLLIAHKDGVVLAGGIYAYDDTIFYYYYGASTSTKRELMAPYLLQWEAITYAKHHTTCLSYDFLGIADDVTDAKDPLYGVSQFKIKFGGQKIWTGRTYDVVLSMALYKLFTLLRHIRSLLRR